MGNPRTPKNVIEQQTPQVDTSAETTAELLKSLKIEIPPITPAISTQEPGAPKHNTHFQSPLRQRANTPKLEKPEQTSTTAMHRRSYSK